MEPFGRPFSIAPHVKKAPQGRHRLCIRVSRAVEHSSGKCSNRLLLHVWSQPPSALLREKAGLGVRFPLFERFSAGSSGNQYERKEAPPEHAVTLAGGEPQERQEVNRERSVPRSFLAHKAA